MADTTKGGRPKTNANANPTHNKSFVVYCYKTFGGRTEIRLVHRKQEPGSTKWTLTGKAEIIKSAGAASNRVGQLLSDWAAAASNQES